MPNEDKPLPEDVEIELSRLASEAAAKLLKQDQAEMAQQEAMKQQQDPLTQIQQRELALKEAEFEHKKQLDIAKLQSDAQAKAANVEVQKDRIESEEKREGARLGVQIAQKADDARREDIRDGIELGREIAREIVGDDE